MTKFDAAFDYILQYEGTEFNDDPTDRGGATKFGISAKFIDRLKDDDLLPSNTLEIWPVKHFYGYDWGRLEQLIDYVRSLSIEHAKWIYQQYFWLPIYEQIEDQGIANYVFDMSVNHGHHGAAELVQRAINACVECRRIKVDGKFGNETLNLLNKIVIYPENLAMLRKCLIAVRESKFRCIVAHDKTQENKLDGWLKRAYGEKL